MRESGHHGDVMETLASVARGLPGDVLCEDEEVMVGMWVRGKRELASRGADSPSLDQWRHRWGRGERVKVKLVHTVGKFDVRLFHGFERAPSLAISRSF